MGENDGNGLKLVITQVLGIAVFSQLGLGSVERWQRTSVTGPSRRINRVPLLSSLNEDVSLGMERTHWSM